MENIFSKMFNKKNEQKQNPEKKSQENQLSPEAQEKFDLWKQNMDLIGKTFDGNTALEREGWLKGKAMFAEQYIYDLYKTGKISEKQVIDIRETLESFCNNNDFDIFYVRGSRFVNERNGVLTWRVQRSIKGLLIDMIRNKKLTSFDEKKVKKLIINEKLYENIKQSSIKKRETFQRKEIESANRLSEFKESGKDKDPIMASDINFSILDIHSQGSNSENPSVLELQPKLPEGLVNLVINVKQIEGTHSKDLYNDKEYENGGFFDIADTSGFLPPKALETIVQKDKNSSVIIYGGHLKACFASAFRQIRQIVSLNSPKAVDIHVPLDKCYENANDQTDEKELPIIPSADSQFEVYKDGNIIEVCKGVKEGNPRSRIYLWSDSSKMFEAINTQHRLDEVRKKISKSE